MEELLLKREIVYAKYNKKYIKLIILKKKLKKLKKKEWKDGNI